MPYLIGNTIKPKLVTSSTITQMTFKISPDILTEQVNQNFTNVFNDLSEDNFQSINYDTQFQTDEINQVSARNLYLTDEYFAADMWEYNDKIFKLNKDDSTLSINYTDEDRSSSTICCTAIVLDPTAFLVAGQKININNSTIVKTSGSNVTFGLGSLSIDSINTALSATRAQSIDIRLRINPNSRVTIDDSDMEIVLYAITKPASVQISFTSNYWNNMEKQLIRLKVRFTQKEFYPL